MTHAMATQAGQGEARWWFGGLAEIKATTDDTGDQTIEASAGDFAWGPRDIPHRYAVGPNGCRMLFICTPAGFENLVRDMSVPAEARTLPPASDEEPDMDMVSAVAQKHHCELLA